MVSIHVVHVFALNVNGLKVGGYGKDLEIGDISRDHGQAVDGGDGSDHGVFMGAAPRPRCPATWIFASFCMSIDSIPCEVISSKRSGLAFRLISHRKIKIQELAPLLLLRTEAGQPLHITFHFPKLDKENPISRAHDPQRCRNAPADVVRESFQKSRVLFMRGQGLHCGGNGRLQCVTKGLQILKQGFRF
jgi:hypothetical protein